MDGGWRHTNTGSQEWVNRLTIAVLTLTIIYLIVGIPDFRRDQAVDLATDAVDPVHRFAWLGLFAAAMPVAAMRWRETLGLLRSSWPLLLLYAYFAASITWALDPDVSMRRFLLAAMQLVQVSVLLSGLKRSATLHVIIAGACIFGATADLLTYLASPGFAMADDGFVGLQLQKNQTGLMLMYGCLSAGTAFFLVQNRLLRMAIAVSVVMMAALLVATRSTTSQTVVILTPVLMPTMLMVARFRAGGVWAVVMGILALLVAVAFGYLAWCGVTGADPWLPMRGVTFTSRTDIWSFVVEEIAKRPWFGAGYNSFWAINPAVQPSLKSDDWFGTYAIINEAHDGYLDLLATGGIVGLVGGLLVVFRTIGIAGRALVQAEPAKLAWQTGRMAHPTAVFHMALLVGLLVHNFTESNLFSNNTGLVVGFLVAALDLEKWRIATKQPARPRYPKPAALRRPAQGASGAAAPAP